MFHLLATTKCKRQQIAILIISFFAYVSGIRNEGNNMLLQQQPTLLRQQQTTIEDSNYQRPASDIKQQTTLNFRPSQIIDFTLADAAMPHKYKYSNTEAQHSISRNIDIYNNNNNNNIPQKQETQNVNRHYTTEAAATYGNAAEKQFSFPNEQRQKPQHLKDKPIYIYRDPFTNENYHYTPTEAAAKYATIPITYSHNNYNNNNAYKQQHSHPQLQHDDNQEYLVQSSMIVGAHQQQQHQQQNNPFRPYMSLSHDKDVYLKRPGVVYDEKPSYNHPNSVIEKKSEETETLKVNKISYDSHDYPPPSYSEQQTSNFLPTPVPAQHTTPTSVIRPIRPKITPPRQDIFRPSSSTQSAIFGQQRPQHQYLSSSQPTLPNYANSIENYLLNKQQTSDYYTIEEPPPLHLPHHQQQPQIQHQYENRPPSFNYVSSASANEHQQQQYFSRPPSYSSAQALYHQYETARPPPGRPSYNNYYDYQLSEVQPQASSPPSQQFNYPYPRPPPQYPHQGSYRPPPPVQQQQQSGFATLAQYAPQFTSLLLRGVGVGGEGSNTNSPLTSLIGALTSTATSQQSSSSSSSSSNNRRPVNSQLIKALENIARNDDLQCVPKVLCQMIAAQTQHGQLPTFITSPAITNFLAGFPAASPALIYGRALLLGLSGGEKSCHQTYVKCPKTEYEIIYYLNNHRGGFFKFFSEPEEQHQTVNHDATQQNPTSLFSILAALTGTAEATTTTTRPTPTPQSPSTDITGGIANFFTQLLSDYMDGESGEYQRSFKRRTKRSLDDKIKFEGESGDVIKFQDGSIESQRDVLKFKDKDYRGDEGGQQDNEEDFHDEEDEEDTQQGFGDDEMEYLGETEGRILQTTSVKGQRNNFFPQMSKETSDEFREDDELREIIKKINHFNKERKLKFPADSNGQKHVEDAPRKKVRHGKILYTDLPNNELNYGHEFTNYVENSYDDFRMETQKVKFIDNDKGEDNEKHTQPVFSYYLKNPKEPKTMLVFPEREGKILNHSYYAAAYVRDYLQQEQLEHKTETAQADNKFIISNIQRPLLFAEFPFTSSTNVYNTHTNSLQSQNSFNSNMAVNSNIYVASSPGNSNINTNHFLPTPAPADNDYTSSNLNYSTKEYINSQDNNKILNQGSYYKPHKYTTVTSNNNLHKPQRYISTSQTNYDQYHSSLYTTRSPYTPVTTTRKSDDKNIYVTNSRGVTEFYITPDGRKVYL